MRTPATIGAAFFVASFLAACASEQLSPEDRAPFCPVIVESKFERPALHPNAFADPAGGPLRAMAGGAGASLMVGTFYAAPIGAIFGLGYGLACATAAASHPAADADFERIFRAAFDTDAFGRSLAAGLNGRPPECGQTANGFARPPRTIVEIEAFDVMMGCAFGVQEYRIAARWRSVSPDAKVLAQRTTLCAQASQHDVDAWFADPERARKEVERALARMGERVAVEVIAPRGLPECRFRSTESGDVASK